MADSAGDNKSLSEATPAMKEKKDEVQAAPADGGEKPAEMKTEAKSDSSVAEQHPAELSTETPMEVEETRTTEGSALAEGKMEGTAHLETASSAPKTEAAKPAVARVIKPEAIATIVTTEAKDGGCYCEKPRKVGTSELLCGICFKYYHADCLSTEALNKYQQEIKIVPFMSNYIFFCKRCNQAGCESYNKKQATFSQMCITTIANLMTQNPGQVVFSKDTDIIPFIEKHWERLTTLPRRIKLTWHTTVYKTMMKELETFTINEDDLADPKFGLFNTDLGRLGPNYDAMFKAPATVYRQDPSTPRVETREMLPLQTKTRGTKRKNPETLTTGYGLKAKKGEVLSTKVAPGGYPAEHPHNKDGYRYILAEPDPHAPNRDAFDASIEWAGKPIPGYLYRTWLEQNVQLALHDRAPQLKISDDRLTILSGEKGYCMARGTHGVRRGAWFFEVTVSAMPTDTATRIGWSQQLGNLQAPCGYDKFSYSWRSRKGTRFHQSMGKHYAEEGYGENDTLGFYIYLPEPEDKGKLLPKTSKDKMCCDPYHVRHHVLADVQSDSVDLYVSVV